MTEAAEEAPQAPAKKKKEKPVKTLEEKLLTPDDRKEIRAGFHKKADDAPTGPACYRCARVTQAWPIKDLDKGQAPSISLAPDDRAFKKARKKDGKTITRHFCARCLRKSSVLELVLAGKKVDKLVPK